MSPARLSPVVRRQIHFGSILIPMVLNIFVNPRGFQCLPHSPLHDSAADREVDVMSLSAPKWSSSGVAGLDGYMPLTSERHTLWPINSRLRRAVSMIRLKKNSGDDELIPDEASVDLETHGGDDKRAMSMMRLRRSNGKVSLFRLRRTPVSMLRLRRRISQLRLKKDFGDEKDLDCDWMPERCEELFNRANFDGFANYNSINNNNNNEESEG